MDIIKLFLAGVITIGVISAFGLHAQGLSQLSTSAGKAGQGLIGTAETGR